MIPIQGADHPGAERDLPRSCAERDHRHPRLPGMALILYPWLEMIARPKEVEPRILGGDPQFD